LLIGLLIYCINNFTRTLMGDTTFQTPYIGLVLSSDQEQAAKKKTIYNTHMSTD